MIIIALILIFFGAIIQVALIPSIKEQLQDIDPSLTDNVLISESVFGIILLVVGFYILRTL